MWKWMRRRRWPLAMGLVTGVLLWMLLLPAQQHVRFERALGPGLGYLVKGPASVSAWLRGGIASLAGLWTAESENSRLREELALLKIEYRQLQETFLQSMPRKQSLKFGRQVFRRLRPARLLARDPSTWFNVITLNLGSEDSVAVGAGVLNHQGAVAKVTSVTATTCKAVFLTDPNSRLAVRVSRSRVVAILVGAGTAGCYLQYLAGQDDVRVGDMVETAPGGISFPAGVPVGEVVQVAKIENGMKLTAEVRLFARLAQLRNLYVTGKNP